MNISDAIKYLIETFLVPAKNRGAYKPNVLKQQNIQSIESKIDGIRVLVFKDPETDKYVVLSRNGKPVYNTAHILKAMKLLLDQGFLFDAEVFVSDWETTMHLTGTRSDLSHEDLQLKLYIFDMLTSEEVKAGGSQVPYLQRRLRMLQTIRTLRSPFVQATERIKVKDQASIDKAFAKFLSKGYEGGMAKASDSTYSFDKTSAWYKLKQVNTADWPCIGYKVGEGKFTDNLGALVVKPIEDPSAPITKGINADTIDVAGFTDEMRKRLYKMCLDGTMAGVFIEVAFTELTKDAVRHPRFKRLRLDKPKADIPWRGEVKR